MTKINSEHLRYLAKRKGKDDDKTLGPKPTNKDKNAKEKKQEEHEDAKCKWNKILSILGWATLAVFVNYIIGSSVIYYLSHPSVVENLNKDYPVDLDASPFCLYSPENLEADNKVLDENNKILAGDCTIIGGIEYLFTALWGKGEEVVEAGYEKLPNADELAEGIAIIGTIAGKESAKAAEDAAAEGASNTVGIPHKGTMVKMNKKGGAAVTPTSTHSTKPSSGTDANSSHKNEPSKPKPKPQPRTLKQIKDRRKNKECEGYKWGDKNYVFGEKQGDQSELGDLHLFNGPAWVAPRGTLTFVALAKYQTILNGWLKWFLNALCSIITPGDTNNYFSKAFLGTFSSVIMVFFIVYFFIAHIFSLGQLSLAIVGDELGRYVADSDTGGTFYCVKEYFSYIFAKLIPIIWVPIVTNLFLFVPLLNSVWKFFLGSYFSVKNYECNMILLEIIKVILFVWLGVLIYTYFKEFSSCPDNDIISIFNMKVASLKMFPIGFAAAASIAFLYVLYS